MFLMQSIQPAKPDGEGCVMPEYLQHAKFCIGGHRALCSIRPCRSPQVFQAFRRIRISQHRQTRMEIRLKTPVHRQDKVRPHGPRSNIHEFFRSRLLKDLISISLRIAVWNNIVRDVWESRLHSAVTNCKLATALSQMLLATRESSDTR